MKRIGIAASKIAKDNVWLYNAYVILISCLFSLFIFIIAGATVIFSLVVISYIGNEVIPVDLKKDWNTILKVCMGVLTTIVVFLNLFAISINLKLFSRKHSVQHES